MVFVSETDVEVGTVSVGCQILDDEAKIMNKRIWPGKYLEKKWNCGKCEKQYEVS